jgi:hypothetical protein
MYSIDLQDCRWFHFDSSVFVACSSIHVDPCFVDDTCEAERMEHSMSALEDTSNLEFSITHDRRLSDNSICTFGILLHGSKPSRPS